ncbi:MAG: LuxR C-terminal-related transcriptional regulator [Chitinophagaceae bacterium]
MIHLGIIEDNSEIIKSIKEYFEHDDEILLVNIATYVDEFVNIYDTKVDVLLLDLSLPFRNGADSINYLCEKFPGISIIIHSVSTDYETIFKCLCNGAHSYLIKGESLQKIREGIINTFNGGSQMSVQIARKVVEFFAKKNLVEELPEEGNLSSREMQVVNSILKGQSYKMVAEELNISINTVRSYIKTIYRKLNINSNLELARIYLKK